MINRLFVVLLFFVKIDLVFAAPDINQLLNKMLETASGANYQATLVLHERGNISSFMVEHRAANGSSREYERLISLQGVKQEMIVDDARMLVLLPNGKRDTVLRNPLADTFLNLHKSLDKYEIKFVGKDRVAGRNSYVLNIKAKDKYHYSYRLWLDQETGLYLRAKWLNHNDNLKSEAMLTSLRFIAPKLNKPVSTFTIKGEFGSEKIIGKQFKDNALKIGWLPPGFMLLEKFDQPAEDQELKKHLVFGDGMVKISVYLDDGSKSALSGFLDIGRTSFFGRKLLNGKHITVLGEMPPVTVQKIAESIEHK